MQRREIWGIGTKLNMDQKSREAEKVKTKAEGKDKDVTC